MKKLLSICFLSIFLLMFGMQAQAQRDCCFQLSNPAGDTLHGIANLPGGNLPLSHSMSPLVFGATDVYDMIFSDANCLGIDEGAKVSVELELWCDGENILDGQHDLSRYCNITLQTFYEELHWVGTPMLQQNYSFVYEYPGAVPIFSGTYNISNVAFDYFYFRFLTNTHSRIVVTWNQIFRDVQLIVHIRERINGTDNSLYWNTHVEESEYYQIGGHQSQPSRVLASDTLTTAPYIEKNDTIKDCEPVVVGMPAYTMDTTGDYKIAYVDTSCGYRIDSIVNYNYTHYVHPTTPTLSDSTIRYCQKGDATPITLDAEPNPALADHVADIVPYWYFAAEDSFYYAASFTPVTDTTAGTYYYYVKRHDNVTGCESEIDTFMVTINPNPAAPVVTDTLVEYCVGETAVALSYTAPAGQQVLWGTTADNITSTTAPVPATTAADTTIYYLKLQDTTTVNNCISEDYDSITVVVYANPTVTITNDNDTLCFGDMASMTVAPTTLTTYQWKKDGVDVTDSTNTHFSYTNDVTDTTVIKFSVAATELHVVKSCSAMDSVEVLAYPEIGAPTAVRGDTAICGPGTVTREVANGAHASTSKWYASDKTTELGTGTTYTQNFTVTDTLYVSSLNDFGCETPVANWTRIIVRVDSVPQITLTTDHVGDSVCAEEDLIIRSSVVPTGYALTYEWKGTGLVAPLNEDSVTFNYATAGTYTDTLKVTITSTGCFNHATIDITVDTLPVIVKDVNYTVNNSTFCVGANGKIEFTTPDYIRYSIDSAMTWRTTKVFDTLAAGNYYLVVEDGRGCKNHANLETIIKDTINPTLTITDSANLRCEAEFNGQLIVSVAPASEAGVHAYKYQLNDGAAQLDSVFTKLENGNTYKITVTDTITGCKTDSLNQVVTDGRVTPVLTLLQNPNTHCTSPFGGSIAVTAMNPAEPVYQYKIVKNLTDTSAYQFDTLFTALEHGFYTVFAQDTATACVGGDTITVQHTMVLPTASINALQEICYGDTNQVTLIGGDTSVVFDYWTYSGPVPATDPMVDTILGKQSFSLKGFPAGKHTFIGHFHDTITHCNSTVADTLRVIDVNIDLLTIPYDAHVCSYDSVKVYCRYFPDDAEDSIVMYNWYANEYHYVASGVFDTLWVTPTYENKRVSIVTYDNHGCSSSKYVDLNVWPLPALTINVSEQNYCQNTTTNINVDPSSTSPYTYAWKKDGAVLTGETGSHLAIPVGLVDFNVTVTVTDAHSCVSDSTFEVNVIETPGAPIFAGDTLYFCDNGVHVDTNQALPQIGDFYWVTGNGNPNDSLKSATYSGYFVQTENSVSCYSDTTDVEVIVTGAPKFDIVTNFNGTPATSEERCYTSSTVTEELSFTITPKAILATAASTTYTYKRNGVTFTPPVDIHRTEPGTYVDTINVKVDATFGTAPNLRDCDWDTTFYFTLIVDSLPVAPDNFPGAYNGGTDSIIFYCAGSTADYDFNAQAGFTYTYSNGSSIIAKPTTAGSYHLIVTNNVTACVDSFPYKIVEVPAPVVAVTHSASDKNCADDVIKDTIIATITNSIDASYTRFFVWNPGDSVAKTINVDSLIHEFSATDTMVTVKTGIYAANGIYTATCYKTPAYDTVLLRFQEKPAMPKLDPTYTYYVDSANAAYCADEYGTFTLTSTDFVTIPGADISIVGHPTGIDTAGVYQVVANNTADPKCPGDTLTLYVREKRTPAEPTNIGPGMYDYKVFFCEGNTPTFTFEKANAKDEFLYSEDGINFVTSVPDTAGHYYLRIRDIVDSCYTTVEFDILQVNTPNFTVTMKPAEWADKDICESSNHFHLDAYQSVTKLHVRPTYVAGHAWRIWDAVDSAFDTPGYHHLYDFDVTADTNLTFVYSEYDTAGNIGYGVSCPFWWSDTITLTYFPTPAAPIYTGDTMFCAGDTVIVTEGSFTFATGLDLTSSVTLPDTIFAATEVITASVHYPTFTTCKSNDTVYTIKRNELPSFNITLDKDTICMHGDTATFTVSNTSLVYSWSTGSSNYSIKVTDTLEYTVTATDSLTTCSKADTAKVAYYPAFTVELSNDTTVCIGVSVDLSATVTGTTEPFTLYWYKDSVITDSLKFTDTPVPSGVAQTHAIVPDSSAIVNGFPVPNQFKIMVEDIHGCMLSADDNIISVSATDRPGFTFHEIDSTKDIHEMKVKCGDQAGFEMIINQNCGDQAERVFVAVQIYKDGVPLTTPELGNAMDYIISNYNTSYEFDVNHVNAPALASVGINACNFSDADYFFPNSEFINYNHYNYDWLYMHFLDGRKITVRTGAFKADAVGDYTFSFAVIKAGPHTAEVGQLYIGSKKVGGYNGHVGLTVLDTVAFDTFTIHVDSSNVSGADNVVNATVTTTPDEAVDAEAINMNVYPNPASNNVNVVMTGVKGQTVITVHDMSGKAVTSMKVDIDDNNQIINLPVDNFSQGIYFIKAVNGSAVMTKKLIIAR